MSPPGKEALLAPYPSETTRISQSPDGRILFRNQGKGRIGLFDTAARNFSPREYDAGSTIVDFVTTQVGAEPTVLKTWPAKNRLSIAVTPDGKSLIIYDAEQTESGFQLKISVWPIP